MNDKNKSKWSWEDNQEKRKNYKDDIHKESYQPTEDTLDDDNPPGGGSGVPDKDED